MGNPRGNEIANLDPTTYASLYGEGVEVGEDDTIAWSEELQTAGAEYGIEMGENSQSSSDSMEGYEEQLRVEHDLFLAFIKDFAIGKMGSFGGNDEDSDEDSDVKTFMNKLYGGILNAETRDEAVGVVKEVLTEYGASGEAAGDDGKVNAFIDLLASMTDNHSGDHNHDIKDKDQDLFLFSHFGNMSVDMSGVKGADYELAEINGKNYAFTAGNGDNVAAANGDDSGSGGMQYGNFARIMNDAISGEDTKKMASGGSEVASGGSEAGDSEGGGHSH